MCVFGGGETCSDVLCSTPELACEGGVGNVSSFLAIISGKPVIAADVMPPVRQGVNFDLCCTQYEEMQLQKWT